MPNQNITLYMHAGSGNHGCEAIVNSTCRLLEQHNITLVSYRKHEDIKYTLKDIVPIVTERSFDQHKIAHVLYYIYRLITKDYNSFMRFKYRDVLKLPTDLAISIGGDNYCYDNMLNDLFLANNVFGERNIKTVLLGCSIEPELIERSDIRNDLSKYHAIIARETITYDSLKTAFKNNGPKLYCIPDPAFTLPTNMLQLPSGFVDGNTVGINLSPIAQEAEITGGITMKAYQELMEYIFENTDYQVALIPHVNWKGNDDSTSTNALYDMFKDTQYQSRMVRIEDSDAETLKGYISRCRFFIGARTHSTIAAYSSCVPTLVVGYSIKARGIAKDIFNDYDLDQLVVPVQNLRNSSQLSEAFRWLENNELVIRSHLRDFMPGYIKRARELTSIIDSL